MDIPEGLHCRCEDGLVCNRVTMCHAAAAYEAGFEAATDPVKEFTDEVLTHAKDYEEQITHGRSVMDGVASLNNLLTAVRAWQNEIADGAPDAHEH